ncbi:MAG: aminoacyl-tRNA hydrolase [Saprospiraceae bacterium]
MLSFIRSLFKKEKEEPNPMKYLIVGLGNPGSDYDDTRHNVGFEVIDNLIKLHKVDMEHESHGDLGEFKFKGRTIILLKPNTYMNLSGKAVRYWMQKKKVQQENILILLDDLNIDFGRVKLKGKGSDGGHNGLKSINELLGGNKYARLRIGIGDDFSRGRQVDYVLGKWTDKEWETLPDILTTSADCVKAFCTVGMAHAMNQYNKK